MLSTRRKTFRKLKLRTYDLLTAAWLTVLLILFVCHAEPRHVAVDIDQQLQVAEGRACAVDQQVAEDTLSKMSLPERVCGTERAVSRRFTAYIRTFPY